RSPAHGSAERGIAGRARALHPRPDRPVSHHGEDRRLARLWRSPGGGHEAPRRRARPSIPRRQDPALVAHRVLEPEGLAAWDVPRRQPQAPPPLSPGVRLPPASPLARAPPLLLHPSPRGAGTAASVGSTHSGGNGIGRSPFLTAGFFAPAREGLFPEGGRGLQFPREPGHR